MLCSRFLECLSEQNIQEPCPFGTHIVAERDNKLRTEVRKFCSVLGSSKWANLKVEHGESIRSAGIQGRGFDVESSEGSKRGSEIWTNAEGEQGVIL